MTTMGEKRWSKSGLTGCVIWCQLGTLLVPAVSLISGACESLRLCTRRPGASLSTPMRPRAAGRSRASRPPRRPLRTPDRGLEHDTHPRVISRPARAGDAQEKALGLVSWRGSCGGPETRPDGGPAGHVAPLSRGDVSLPPSLWRPQQTDGERSGWQVLGERETPQH